VFNRSIVDCHVCLSQKSGINCIQLPCEDIFCKDCLSEYFSVLIKEGSVSDLKCPNCGIAMPQYIVKQTVNEELFERYDRIILERSLDQMDDIHYCPRTTCRTPCIVLSPEGMF
jgi:E3 ubiquitin-protein ligase RNF14